MLIERSGIHQVKATRNKNPPVICWDHRFDRG